MDDPKKLGDWLSFLHSILGWLAALAAAAVVGHRWIVRAIRGILLSERIHDRYGGDPVAKLAAILEEIRACHGQIDVIQGLLVERIGLSIYVCDATGKCIGANRNLCDLFGMDEHDMLGQGWLRAVGEDDRVEVWDEWRRCVAAGVPYDCQFKMTNQRTQERHTVRSVAYSVHVDGTVRCFVGYVVQVDS